MENEEIVEVPVDAQIKVAQEPEQVLAFFLVAGKVSYLVGKSTYTKDINVLMDSATGSFNQPMIANAQKAIQMRFYNEFVQNKDAVTVTDVFLYGISLLGGMTRSEFCPPDFLAEVMKLRAEAAAKEAPANV